MGGREYFPLLASLLDQFHSLIGKYLLITFSVPGTHILMGHPQPPSDAENLLGPHWKQFHENLMWDLILKLKVNI